MTTSPARRARRRGAVPAARLAPTQIDPRLALIQIADSALPVGTFAHSFGMETALFEGGVTGEIEVAAWLAEYVRGQMVTTDLLALRAAHALVNAGADTADTAHAESASVEEAGLIELDEVLTAVSLASEVREASHSMGARLLELATDCFPSPAITRYADLTAAGETGGHYVIAYGLATAGMGVDLPEAMRTYAASVVIGLAQNAVRAVPLGQVAGQRVIAHLHPVITAACESALTVPLDLLGAASPQLEVAQMRHERQHARMFTS